MPLRKRNVLIPSWHHLCSLISHAEDILHLVPEEEIILLQIFTSLVACLCVLMRLKSKRSYSLKGLSQCKGDSVASLKEMVATEAFQHSVHITANTEKMERGKEGGGQAAHFGGLRLRSMALDQEQI